MKNSTVILWLGVYTLSLVLLIVIIMSVELAAGPAIIALIALISFTAFRMIWRHLQRQQNQIDIILRSLINNDSEVRLTNPNKLQPLLTEVQMAVSQGRIEAEVQASYLKALIVQLDIGVFEFDHEGYIINSNPAAERLVSLEFIQTWQAVISKGSNHVALAHHENINRFKQILSDENLNGQGELKWSYPNRKETFLYSRIHSFISGQSRTLLTLQSIEKQMVAKEVNAYQQLVKVLTHEVANSITPMVSLAQSAQSLAGQLMPDSRKQSEQLQDLQEALTTVSRRGQHLTDFINSFATLSQPVNVQLQTVKLVEPVNEVVRLIADETKNVVLGIEVSDELEVMIDPALFEQVLLNLLRNALEATLNRTEPRIQIMAACTGERTYLEIKDNGPGIPRHTAENIFIPFFTTKRNGNGIGLPLARSLMLSQGGNLLLCQEERCPDSLRTCFKVTF